MTTDRFDLVVIGAGPAGMACALRADALGLSVLVIDENPQPGGQIYRNVGHSPLPDPARLGTDYTDGAALVQRFSASPVSYWPDTLVWQVSRSLDISFTRRGRTTESGQIRAKALVIANGAYERPFSVPGWTLPGVMSVGAAQTLVKSAGLFPDVPTVLAGSGPLLYLFAWQLIRAGRPPAAILETTPADSWRRALPHLPAALRTPGYLLKGLKLLRAIRQAGVTHVRHVTELAIEGAERAGQVRYRSGSQSGGQTSSQNTIAAGLVLLHQGVVPNVQLTRSIGCAHDWDDAQRCWRPRTDSWGETSIPNIFTAGDGAGIGGATGARIDGERTALAVAHRLGSLDTRSFRMHTEPLERQRRRHLRVRPFLDTLYGPSEAFRRPSDPTIVCRCEEVTAGQIRDMARLGCVGPNQTKSFSRCGMGPCQGRLCGLTVSELISEQTGQRMDETGYYNVRPPIKPVSLGDLAVSFIPNENAAKPTEWVPK
ncbi:NAD(P)/FAD-dependent oxidoreductase [Burkholderia multivorans]|uniref:FAD/NAD(P)-binding oxidoreductase n=1 Tax=Burkholderia multivorans TaxID=87883 RepID=A0AB37APP2_9BURK|nr:NAD(P)/FAD-dependent oxidoreductase [Burkholderia multivorans]PRE45406.1 FAD/NAD(P)-binding oxidoreductase [Burkholderia multivorans]PRE52091.1 FAD/NAD(P)-binding oxidoreductase [Burkholderia multivorans]